MNRYTFRVKWSSVYFTNYTVNAKTVNSAWAKALRIIKKEKRPIYAITMRKGG